MSLARSSAILPAGYGAMHFVVDATTVTVVLSCGWLHALSMSETFLLVLAYDLLAFASQTFFALAIDRLQLFRGALIAGLFVAASAVVVVPLEPITATVLAGIGNALFHVGAGAITLCVSGGRASPNGIFVAPGALGLGLGTYLGRNGLFVAWPFLVALAISIVAALVLARRSERDLEEVPSARPSPVARALPARRLAYLVLALLLVSVAVRSYVGFAGAHRCPSGPGTALGLTLAAFGGKALGGIASDRLGWMRVSVGALVLSAPLIAFGADAGAVILGLFLFQMTMPVTLSAVFALFPSRPAFAFGITCLALVLGVLPTFAGGASSDASPLVLVALVLGSAASIHAGLRMLGIDERMVPTLRRAA